MANNRLYLYISAAAAAVCIALYPFNALIARSILAGYLVMVLDYVLIDRSIKKMLDKSGDAGKKVTLAVFSYMSRLAVITLVLIVVIKAKGLFNVLWLLCGITAAVVAMFVVQMLGKKD